MLLQLFLSLQRINEKLVLRPRINSPLQFVSIKLLANLLKTCFLAIVMSGIFLFYECFLPIWCISITHKSQLHIKILCEFCILRRFFAGMGKESDGVAYLGLGS